MNYAELHRELWNWLADNPGEQKCDWPRWEFNGGDVPKVETLCFACQFVVDNGGNGCPQCPIFDWYCRSEGMPFAEWIDAWRINAELASDIARQIANLPWRNYMLITTTEAARKLGITRQAVAKRIRTGRVKARKWGNIWLVDMESLKAFVPAKAGRKGVAHDQN